MEQKSCRDRRPCQTKVQALSGILGYKESTLVWSVPPTKKTWWELDWNSKLNTTQKPWFYMYHYSVKKWCCSAQNWTTRCRRSLGLQVISGNSVSSHRGFAWDVHRAMGAKSTMTCHIEHYSIIMFSYYTWLYMYIYIYTYIIMYHQSPFMDFLSLVISKFGSPFPPMISTVLYPNRQKFGKSPVFETHPKLPAKTAMLHRYNSWSFIDKYG